MTIYSLRMPWLVVADKFGHLSVYESPEPDTVGTGDVIAEVYQDDDVAHLVAASPDLLEACTALITACDANDVPAGEKAVALMRAAIAKATGK